MKPWFTSLLTGAALLLFAGASRATTDGGFTAALIGTAQSGRLAIIAESSIQEECVHAACAVYDIDTTAAEFRRLDLVELRPRYDVLKDQHCRTKSSADCARLVSSYLLEEQRAARRAGSSEHALVLERYLDALTIWQKAALGPISPTPAMQRLSGTENYDGAARELVLSELPPPPLAGGETTSGPLTLRLEERWTAPSFRATTDQDQHCYPPRVRSCHQEERWEDGAPELVWICDGPQGDSLDCAGRASLVRVEGRWGHGPVAHGRSSWVEPGRLAQAAMNMVRDRTVDLDSLAIARHGIAVYALPHATLIVGGFAHGIFANGTWFPLVVATPHRRHETPSN